MKQRIVVMNGARIVQIEHDGKWKNDKVDKAGALRPGLYNIYLAKQADPTQTHEGVIIHTSSDSVYQVVGASYVKHDRAAFDKTPEVGSTKHIAYSQSRAIVSEPTQKRSRGFSR
jgi:hypothetical protein